MRAFSLLLPFVAAFMLLGSFSDAIAQGYDSEQGRFTVNQIKGCAPLDVEVIQEDDSQLAGNTSPRIYKFNYDGNLRRVFVDENQTDQDTTYAIPGTYKILQVVGDVLDSITIEVLEPRPPQVDVFNCIDNSVFLEMNDDYYDRFRIDFGDGYSSVDVANGQPSYVYKYDSPGEYTISVQGIFDNADSEACAAVDTTITTINDLTVADLTAVSIEGERAVRVRYDLPNPAVSYRLEVAEEGSDNFGYAQIDLENNSELLIDDLDFNLRRESYCFRIVAVNRCDESLSKSSEVLCSIALQGEAQDQQNELTWSADSPLDYQVSRNDAPVTATSENSLIDTDVECQQDYQYRVFSERPDGAVTSSILTLTAQSLTVSPALDSVEVQIPGQQINVVWRATSEATQYYVYRGVDGQDLVLYDSISTLDSVALPSGYEDPQVTVDTEYCYQLTYRDACGNESFRNERVCATIPTQGEVHFPNAFTPNGDGLNDVFLYTSRLVEEVDMQIYNRWGEILFQTNQLDVGWDGTYQGTLAPQGTYLYKIAVTDQLGNRFTRQGSFVLLPR